MATAYFPQVFDRFSPNGAWVSNVPSFGRDGEFLQRNIRHVRDHWSEQLARAFMHAESDDDHLLYRPPVPKRVYQVPVYYRFLGKGKSSSQPLVDLDENT